MKANILIYISVLALCAGFYSCDDRGIPKDLEFDQFKYIWLTSAREGEISLTLSEEQDTTITVGAIRYGGMSTPVSGDISAEIGMDAALVATYNTANNTNYAAIPAGCYSLNKTSLSIASGSFASEPFSLTIKNTGNLESDKSYLIPVTVRTVSAPEGLTLSEEYKTAYVVIHSNIVHYDQTLDKNRWEIIEASSVWAAGYETARLLDGDRSTYWHSALTGMPQWFILDMKGPKLITGFYFVHRQETDQTSTPKTVKFEVSFDKINWTTAYESSDLNQSKMRIEIPLNRQVGARYIRFTCSETVSKGNYTYVAEIGAYSATEVEKPLILSGAPASNTTVLTPEVQNLSFTWSVDKAVAGGYKLLFSKNQTMTSPTEFATSSTSYSMTKAQLESLMGGDEPAIIYWQVVAAGGESLAVPSAIRSLRLTSAVLTGIPMSFDVNTKNSVSVTENGSDITITTTGGDPWIHTSKLGQTFEAGKKYFVAFDYKSNQTITNAEFFFCVDGGPVGGKSSGENITLPEATTWSRFEYELTNAANNFGFGSNANHFLRYDLTSGAGYEITIRNFFITSK
ncbi:MAG: DUF1735 domain-containing protein [Tannerella sp.]|nr:DUF1735 domain-containing protein [Tannerella sp.]